MQKKIISKKTEKTDRKPKNIKKSLGMYLLHKFAVFSKIFTEFEDKLSPEFHELLKTQLPTQKDIQDFHRTFFMNIPHEFHPLNYSKCNVISAYENILQFINQKFKKDRNFNNVIKQKKLKIEKTLLNFSNLTKETKARETMFKTALQNFAFTIINKNLYLFHPKNKKAFKIFIIYGIESSSNESNLIREFFKFKGNKAIILNQEQIKVLIQQKKEKEIDFFFIFHPKKLLQDNTLNNSNFSLCPSAIDTILKKPPRIADNWKWWLAKLSKKHKIPTLMTFIHGIESYVVRKFFNLDVENITTHNQLPFPTAYILENQKKKLPFNHPKQIAIDMTALYFKECLFRSIDVFIPDELKL